MTNSDFRLSKATKILFSTFKDKVLRNVYKKMMVSAESTNSNSERATMMYDINANGTKAGGNNKSK